MSRGLTEVNIGDIRHWADRLREARKEDRDKSGALAFGVEGEAWLEEEDPNPFSIKKIEMGIYESIKRGSTSDKLKVTTKSGSRRESFYPGHEVNFGADFPEYAVVGSPREEGQPGYSKGQYYQMLYCYEADYAVSAAGAIKPDGAQISKVYDFLVPGESVDFTDKSGVNVTARCEFVTQLTTTEAGRYPVQVRRIRFEVDGKDPHSILQFLPRDNLSIKEAAQVRLYLRENGVDVTNKNTKAVINCADGSDRSGSRAALFHLLDQIEKKSELLGSNLYYLLKLCSIMVQEQTHNSASETGIKALEFFKEFTGQDGFKQNKIDDLVKEDYGEVQIYDAHAGDYVKDPSCKFDPKGLLQNFQRLPGGGIRVILEQYLEQVQAAARSRDVGGAANAIGGGDLASAGGFDPNQIEMAIAPSLEEVSMVAHAPPPTGGEPVHLASAQREGVTYAARSESLAIIRDVFSPKLRLFGYDYEGGAESLPEKTPADFLNVSVDEEGGVKKIKISHNPEVDEAISKRLIEQIKAAMLDPDLGLLHRHSTSEKDISSSRAKASLEFDVRDVNVEQLQANGLGYFADVIDVLNGASFNPSRDTIDNLKRLAVRLHEIRSFFQDKRGKTTKFTKDEMPQDLLFDFVKNFIPGFNEGAVVKTKILDQKGGGYVGEIKEEDKHCYIAFNLAGTTIADPNYPPPYTVFIDPYDLEFSLTPGSHLRGYDEKFRGVSHHLIAQDATDLSRSSRVGRVFDGFYIDADNQQAIHDEIKLVMAMEESIESAQTAQERFVAPEYNLTEDSIVSLQRIMSRQKVRNPDSGFQSLYSKKADGSFVEELDQLISEDGTRLVSICSPQGFEDNQDGGVTALSIAAMVNPPSEVIRSKNRDGRPLFDIDGEVESQRILIPLNKGRAHWDLLVIDVDRESKKLTFFNIATNGIIYPAPRSIVDSVTIDGYTKENLLKPAHYYNTGAQLGQNCGIATTLMMQDQMSEFLTGRKERLYDGFYDIFDRLQSQLRELKDKAVVSSVVGSDSIQDYAKAIIEAGKGGRTASDSEVEAYLSERYTERTFAKTDDAKKFIVSNRVEFQKIGFKSSDEDLGKLDIESLQKMILKYYLVQATYNPDKFRIIQRFDSEVRNMVYYKATNQENLDGEDVEALASDIEKIAVNFDGRARGEIGARSSVQQIYNKHLNRLSEDRLFQLFITEFSKLDEYGRQTVYDYMLQCIDLVDDRDKKEALKKIPQGNMRNLLLTSGGELKSHGRVTILDIFDRLIVPFLDERGLSVIEPDTPQVLTAARHQDPTVRSQEGWPLTTAFSKPAELTDPAVGESNTSIVSAGPLSSKDDSIEDLRAKAAALKAKQQAEAQERAQQQAAKRLSDLNSYLQSSSSPDPQHDSNADISALKAEIKKNKNNPKPKTPYRGAGIKSDLVQYGDNQYALQIADIFPPKEGRFSDIGGAVEEIFGDDRVVDEEMKGGLITGVFIDEREGEKFLSITQIINGKGEDLNAALQEIAVIFHNPKSVKFKVVTAGEGGETKELKIKCDNSRNSTSVFAPSKSATSDFKAMSSMTDKEKLEILSGLSTPRDAPSSSPRGVTTKGTVLNDPAGKGK